MNKKHLTNIKIDNKVNNNINKKTDLDQSNLKWELINNQALASKDLNAIANKVRILNIDKINSWTNLVSIC